MMSLAYCHRFSFCIQDSQRRNGTDHETKQILDFQTIQGMNKLIQHQKYDNVFSTKNTVGSTISLSPSDNGVTFIFLITFDKVFYSTSTVHSVLLHTTSILQCILLQIPYVLLYIIYYIIILLFPIYSCTIHSLYVYIYIFICII